jgi:hypothetical protein
LVSQLFIFYDMHIIFYEYYWKISIDLHRIFYDYNMKFYQDIFWSTHNIYDCNMNHEFLSRISFDLHIIFYDCNIIYEYKLRLFFGFTTVHIILWLQYYLWILINVLS